MDNFQSMDVLGVPITVTNLDEAVNSIIAWAEHSEVRRVFLRDVHGIMQARNDERFRRLHFKADMVLPDGMPLVWLGRLRGYGQKIQRTPGADVVEAVCMASVRYGFSHYFYGGKPHIAELMARNLSDRFPGLNVAGCFSPPMRGVHSGDFSWDELREIDAIRNSGADFIWVGISTPKQENWINAAASHLDKGILFGVGAAFDFHADVVKRAPKWMRNFGLEWLFRLSSEPTRLWRRYILVVSRFPFSLLLYSIRRRDN